MSYLHLLNLDTVGGVEELFIHFLENAKSLSSIEQHVLVTGYRPHPFFAEKLVYADTVSLEKYLGSWKIPSFMRPWKRAYCLRKISANTVILWNRLERAATAKKVIYYEHGASWIEPCSKEVTHFFSSVDKIIANSFAAKRLLELKWQINCPITVLENPLKPTVQAALGPKKIAQTIRLGYIGRLIPLKGVCLLLHAFKALKGLDVTLTIAGDGPEKAALIAESARLGIKVSFLGVVKNVSEFYDAIDILLVPSIREPLGLVAQEAALRGCLVIAANVDGLPEVVKHNVTGRCLNPTLSIDSYSEFGGTTQRLPDVVYDPDSDMLSSPRLVDPQAITQAVIELTSDPVQFARMSQNAIEFAQLRPNFLGYTKQLLDLIQT